MSAISARLKSPRKHELSKSHSHSQLLANQLRADGRMSTVESCMQAVDEIAAVLSSPHDPNISYKDSIINLCQHLKVYGGFLEILYQDQLNRAFVVFRNSSQDNDRLDYLSRLHLLELIELRGKGWKGTDLMNQYYRKKVNQCSQAESVLLCDSASSIMSDSLISNIPATSPPLLAPGEVLKPSGKFNRPTRIPGKNYCKDEVVIRNADSGKVMGIKGRRVHMIEELSETIISFQRVNPGAKERLVQITGANEESINHAKQLMEDTIRRNASPVREMLPTTGAHLLTGSSSSINSSASEDSALPHSARASRALLHSLSTNDATLGVYKYTVVVGGHTIKITSDNLDLVRTSKLVLDEYFSGEPLQDVRHFYSFDNLPQTVEGASRASSEMPLSPPESLPSPEVVNGESNNEEALAPLRRPRQLAEDVIKGNLVCNRNDKAKHAYSNERLVKLAMSPFCLVPPNDWERIVNEYPILVKKVIKFFDATSYLTSHSEGAEFVSNNEEQVDD